MENAIVSGMIPMFLSGLTQCVEIDSNDTSAGPVTEKPRRLLLAYSGASLELSHVAKNMAFGFGGKDAGTTIYKIPENTHQYRSKDLTAYDGIFIGIAPDGSGATHAAFSFIRDHINVLSAMPVALFFLLSRAPKLGRDNNAGEHLFEGLSPMSPLDVRIFERSGPHLSSAVMKWALNDIWPLMETGWLADLIFPGPDEIVVPEPMPELMLSHG